MSTLFTYCIAGVISVAYANQMWKEAHITNWKEIDHVSAWENWKAVFNKKYASPEIEETKFLTFIENWENINAFNGVQNGYMQTLNKFGDLNANEFKTHVGGDNNSCLKGLKSKWINKTGKLGANMYADIPESKDWTNINGKSYVTLVKNQGQCGSCYAFSTTGAIESRYAIKNNITADNIPTLSEQQIVDCSQSFGNDGCNGGLMDHGFEYVNHTHGLCSEDEYKYTGDVGVCNDVNCGTKYDNIKGYIDVTINNEIELMKAVSNGPVSIAIQANQKSFQFYSEGVLTGRCGDRIDHGVLVVGYGNLNGTDYWKVKNSWGPDWGINGYVLICRNCNKNKNEGECGILMQPSYPIPY